MPKGVCQVHNHGILGENWIKLFTLDVELMKLETIEMQECRLSSLLSVSLFIFMNNLSFYRIYIFLLWDKLLFPSEDTRISTSEWSIICKFASKLRIYGSARYLLRSFFRYFFFFLFLWSRITIARSDIVNATHWRKFVILFSRQLC